MTAPAPASDRATTAAEDAGPLEIELAALRKLWLILAAIGLVICINVLAATQGGDVTLTIKTTLGFELDKDAPEAIAGLWGVVYLSLFAILTNAVALAHASKSAGPWSSRYPFRIFELSPVRGVGLAAQLIAFVVLTVAPAYVIGHSWRQMLDHGVFCHEVADADWRVASTGPAGFTLSEPARVRLTSNEAVNDPKEPDKCDNAKMTDFGRPWQTWIMALFSLSAAGVLVWMVVALFAGGLPRHVQPDSAAAHFGSDRE